MTGLKVLQQMDVEERKKHMHEAYQWSIKPSSKYKSDRKANDLTRCIIRYITLLGYQAERVSSSGRVVGKKKTFTDAVGITRQIGQVTYIPGTSRNGTADISATIKGRSVKIEVKIGEDRQSGAQKSYQEEVEQAGGIYYIAKDFQSFFDWVNELIKEL